jgi:fermentation-respiration switch protein FrsA (DUF1100 family)
LTAGAFFYLKQDKLLFPAPKEFDKATPAAPFEDLRIPVAAGGYLHAWWIPSASQTAKVILVFHGNGYVLEDMAIDEAVRLREIGANLLLVDYRGYGLSTAISPNESTVDEDADAALGYVLQRRGIPIGKIVLLGRSIGSGPATYLASKNAGLGGLILESPFSSIDDAAAGSWYFRIYPLGLMLRTHFDNVSKIGSVRVPLLVASGTADSVTPEWMAQKIFARAHQPKQFYIVPDAGHNDLLSVGGKALTEVLRKFVGEPSPPAAP